MLGPVMMSMRRSESSSRSFGTNGRVGEALDDRVPAALDLEHASATSSGCVHSSAAGALGERRERIEHRQRAAGGLHGAEALDELCQDAS